MAQCFVALLFFFDELFQTADVLAVLPDGDDGYCLVIHEIYYLVQFGGECAVGDVKFQVFHKNPSEAGMVL